MRNFRFHRHWSAATLSLLCLLVLGISRPLRAQANVNEGLETAPIYVDATNGSDHNNGSKTSPLKTIGAAVTLAIANNDASIGSRVIINPGTYREAVVIQGNRKSTSLPITFQAATNGTVIVSGADPITGWTAYKGSSSIYEASWPYNFAVCPAQAAPAPAQQQISLHTEMLVVNGMPLTQVLTFSSMLPGTFYVDNAHALVYMYPPAGTNVTTATVEAAARPFVWQIGGQSNVVVRGLTFQYANSCPQNAAVLVGGNATNILFDTDTILWNNAMGIHFTTVEQFTVQNSTANYNGQVGFASHEVKNSLWQNNTANYNNWRGAQGAFYTWDTGGAKWMWDHNGTYKNIVSTFNQANGLFWDTDNENVTLTSGVSAMNLVNGIQIEKAQGPFSVAGSSVCYDNLLNVGARGGIALRNSEQVSVTGTSLYGSLLSQFVIVGQSGGIVISNWETGQSYNLITEKFTSSSNVVSGTSAVFTDSYLGGSDWSAFVSTVKSNSNTFWDGSSSNAFVVPTPRAGTNINLGSWQSQTGQDKSSTWTSTSAPSACNVAAQSKDFWVTSSTYAGATTNSSRQATINIATFGLGGISGNVNLTLDGVTAVPGLKASMSAAAIPVTGNAVLTLTASPSTPAGTYPITILGNLGNTTHTVTVSLFVR